MGIPRQNDGGILARFIHGLSNFLSTALGIWAVMNVVSVILSFAVPTIVVGTVFGSVLGAIAVVSAWFGWKWDLARPQPRDISKGYLLKGALLAFVTYLALELLLPWIGMSVPIIYASPEWFGVLVMIRGLVFGASIFMLARLFALLHRAGRTRLTGGTS